MNPNFPISTIIKVLHYRKLDAYYSLLKRNVTQISAVNLIRYSNVWKTLSVSILTINVVLKSDNCIYP